MANNNQSVMLQMKTVTWLKDSHSLFDYQFNKNVTQTMFQFTLKQKHVYIFRENTKSEIIIKQYSHFQNSIFNEITPYFQLLGSFELNRVNAHKIRIRFYHVSQLWKMRLSTVEMERQQNQAYKNQDIYLIVRSLKNKHNENKGYKLKIGQTIKLGRVQYQITEINSQSISASSSRDKFSKFWTNQRIIEVPSKLALSNQEQCKYCLLGEIDEPGYFLCSPCNCIGSCAKVHFKCLEMWNQSKVKKQIVGGTQHYNFEKFFCEVCKQQYPKYIKKNEQIFELMPIQKPQGDHLIIEGITDKANNMMVIQNIPSDGIKMGRGHECEIKITDISVSRNHSRIQKNKDDYYIYDNKSKFGTLVKQENLEFDLSKIKQGVQIGRTVATFELVCKNISV